MTRVLDCSCGARLEAEDDALLLVIARQHADEQHGGDPRHSEMELQADIERAAHPDEEREEQAMNRELEVVFEGGPRAGEREVIGDRVVVIGTGAEGGVYQRTDEERSGRVVYRWQQLTDAEAAALMDADIRAEERPAE
jgi:hypothetical protein